ncbi:hypothetical protein H1R20_g1223, partial [Candolleomyces eurysporus]
MPPGTLSLKQRLAALALAPSSPSTYDNDSSGSSLRSTLKKKAQQHAPWLKRREDSTLEPTANEVEQVQQVLSKVIFQAGVDYEVVLNASALPDPDVVSYDLLLSRILAYLNLYVEADYTVVFFAAGSNHTPGWNWVWKAYRSLSRKYRKNLKQLYIVHSSFFSKMLFSLAGAIIRENLKYEDKITLPIPTRSNVFGVPLEDLMGFDGEKGGLPRVVRDCIVYIHQYGLLEEGLFRRSPSSALLRAAQDAYDRGNVVTLDSFGDPHLAAVLLKKFLRDLPEPIFPESLYPTIHDCPPPTKDLSDMNGVTYIRESLLPYLTPCAYILLSHILQLCHDVAIRSATNRMDDYNLAIVLTPNLVKGSNPMRDVAMSAVAGVPALAARNPLVATAESKTTLGSIIALCIRRYYEIFDEIPDRADAGGSTLVSQSQSHSSFLSSQQLSPAPSEASYVIQDEDDEDIDDEDYATHAEASAGAPGHRSRKSVQLQQQQQQNLQFGGASPPSAWSTAGAGSNGKRHRTTPSGGTTSSGVKSMHTVLGEGSTTTTGGVGTHGRAKSVISIDKGTGAQGHRKGTISVGRGTTRKSVGSGVEAVGITAEGFFSDPKGAPPVPPRSSKPGSP